MVSRTCEADRIQERERVLTRKDRRQWYVFVMGKCQFCILASSFFFFSFLNPRQGGRVGDES